MIDVETQTDTTRTNGRTSTGHGLRAYHTAWRSVFVLLVEHLEYQRMSADDPQVAVIDKLVSEFVRRGHLGEPAVELYTRGEDGAR